MAMTPAEEAAYALDNRLDRDSLSREVQAEYDRLLQERYFAASRGEKYDPGGAARPTEQPHTADGLALPLRQRPAAQQEDLALKYARETRNAAVFIAWVVGIVMVLSLIGVIVTAVELSHLSNAINNGGGSNCVPGITC